MNILNTVIYILIGIIGGRGIEHRDWVTVFFTAVLFALFLIFDWHQNKKNSDR